MDLKVGLISTESIITPPPEYGGIESVVYNLAKGLVAKDIDLTLFACNQSKSPSKLVEVIEQGWGRTGQCEEFERRMINMKDLIRTFDVVHDHSHQKPCWKIHDHVLNTMHWEQHPAQCNYINVTAISNYIAGWLQQHMSDREIPVVHHGIDISDYKYNDKKGDYFLYLSAIYQEKGALVALDVAKDMGFEMYFAGRRGRAAEKVEADIEAGHNNIHYLGQVSMEKKVELYSNAKALIFPSGYNPSKWIEPLGLVVIEAMASGTPVIGWNAGALKETIVHEKTGFLCSSIDEIKTAVNRIDEISCRECRRWVEENFTIESMTKKYINLYQRVLEGRF